MLCKRAHALGDLGELLAIDVWGGQHDVAKSDVGAHLGDPGQHVEQRLIAHAVRDEMDVLCPRLRGHHLEKRAQVGLGERALSLSVT